MTTEVKGWYSKALCQGMDTSIFFPQSGYYTEARKVCRACPVQPECLGFAMSFTQTEDTSGMFGGVGPRGRQELRRILAQPLTTEYEGANT